MSDSINVTPLIDVVMCLIIFFLIVGKLASDASAVRLAPSGIGRSADAGRAVVVAIATADSPSSVAPSDWGGTRARVFVDGQPAKNIAELESLLRETAQRRFPGRALAELPVQIRADRELPFAAIDPAFQACSRLGILGVNLATERTP